MIEFKTLKSISLNKAYSYSGVVVALIQNAECAKGINERELVNFADI